MSPAVSVIICAYAPQRQAHLQACIEAVRQQTLPAREIILVIDHNAQLLTWARKTFPGVRVVPNRRPRGLSGARNTGIAAASAEILAFVDDDATIAADWLEKLCACLDDPTTLGARGTVVPQWESPRPRWFPAEFHWVVGCTYTGLPPARAPVRNLSGGCMCIRREVFDAVGGFRTEVGRIGTKPLGCEETELCIRAGQRWPHARWMYEPAAVMHHAVPATRCRWSYFCSRCFYEGRSKALVTRMVGARDGLATERSYTARTLPVGVVRGVADTLAHGDISGLARAAAIVAGLTITALGYAIGLCAQRMASPRQRLRSLFSVSGVPGGTTGPHPKPAISRTAGAHNGD